MQTQMYMHACTHPSAHTSTTSTTIHYIHCINYIHAHTSDLCVHIPCLVGKGPGSKPRVQEFHAARFAGRSPRRKAPLCSAFPVEGWGFRIQGAGLGPAFRGFWSDHDRSDDLEEHVRTIMMMLVMLLMMTMMVLLM